MTDVKFRATVKHVGAEVGDLPWLEELWAVRYDDYAALQARVAELEAERDAWQKRAAMSVRGRKAAEALLSEAVKAGMLEGAKAADCGCLPDKSDCLAVKNSVPICYRDGAAEIDAFASDPETIARIVAQLKEGRG